MSEKTIKQNNPLQRIKNLRSNSSTKEIVVTLPYGITLSVLHFRRPEDNAVLTFQVYEFNNPSNFTIIRAMKRTCKRNKE